MYKGDAGSIYYVKCLIQETYNEYAGTLHGKTVVKRLSSSFQKWLIAVLYIPRPLTTYFVHLIGTPTTRLSTVVMIGALLFQKHLLRILSEYQMVLIHILSVQVRKLKHFFFILISAEHEIYPAHKC